MNNAALATVPADSDTPTSATWVCQPSPLVLAAMTLGLSAAEAIRLVAARAAESARLAAFDIAL